MSALLFSSASLLFRCLFSLLVVSGGCFPMILWFGPASSASSPSSRQVPSFHDTSSSSLRRLFFSPPLISFSGALFSLLVGAGGCFPLILLFGPGLPASCSLSSLSAHFGVCRARAHAVAHFSRTVLSASTESFPGWKLSTFSRASSSRASFQVTFIVDGPFWA